MRWHLKDPELADRAMALPANASLKALFDQVRLAFPWAHPRFDMSVFASDPAAEILDGVNVFLRDRGVDYDPDIKLRARGTHVSVSVAAPHDWFVNLPIPPSSLDVHGAVGAAVAEIRKMDWADNDKCFRQTFVDLNMPGVILPAKQEVVLSPTRFAFWERTWRRWKFCADEAASGTFTGRAWTLNEVLDGAIERECVWP